MNNIPFYFIGLSLCASSINESGVAVLDRNKKIVMLDKLYSVGDIKQFFDNFSSLKNSVVLVSWALDNSLLDGKWRFHSKPYCQLSHNPLIINKNCWTKRYSERANDLFNDVKNKAAAFYRYDIALTRQAFGLNSSFLNRSVHDCQFFQNSLKNIFATDELPDNMVPAASLEALMGAILAYRVAFGEPNKEFKVISKVNETETILPVY